ncbi:MAG: hypothetical protein NTY48_06410 [Candidatus Diapherotrites archaeon]|nr:hypothetical protein [Candidatus Diapherotrites archaeon]
MPNPLGRKAPLSLRKRALGSATYFKDPVSPAHYSIRQHPEWRYFDNHVAKNPHLVLFDHQRRPRCTLGFELHQVPNTPPVLIINSIQRETLYRRMRFDIDTKLEKEEGARFKQMLSGMHPSEFILSEFLSQNRERITKGVPVYLLLDYPKGYYSARRLAKDKIAPVEHIENYKPLIDRFFFRKEEVLPYAYQLANGDWTTEPARVVRLNPNKERVKQILGLK